MKEYNPKEIEPKWQKVWESNGLGQAKGQGSKYYTLVEFPYPSGDGLHVGHVRSYTALDAVSRKRRMEGYDVLYPIGWDAFGLPTENYAIKTGRAPAEITKENTDNFRRQMKSLGLSFDWSREVNTTDPKYYKWTQWIFLQFLKHGLAYKAKTKVNWCPKDKIVLANEEVIDGRCERCGTVVEEREKEQWLLKITQYAERLLEGLNHVDYPDRVKAQQRNWIGKSEGAEIEFEVKGEDKKIKVFTTRPDTIFGATFLVMAGKTDRFTGKYAINPATKEEIPVWEAEYVLSDYGTGAIMAVPADDERDMEFATKHKLPIVTDYPKAGFEDYGEKVIKYKLRDWIFSRQRYWGEPIPVIHCEKCGVVPVPEENLPIELPKVEKYQPTDTGDSPLANISEWVNVNCPKCDGPAKRETDVMPNWAGSSWYFLRYTDPKNDQEVASKGALEHWMPVDWYNGGMEHTTLHLLYSRFWHKFLFDIGVIPKDVGDEPYKKRTSHGLILAEGGEKMSKSKGNVVNPDHVIQQFGTDTLRVYEMFMGPFEQAIAWSEKALVGPRRFLERVWRLREKVQDISVTQEYLLHSTIKKVSEDIETLGFNTAISTLMIFVNELEAEEAISKEEYETLIKLMTPFAPHLAEELWQSLSHTGSIAFEKWPQFDPNKLIRKEVVYAIQVNGKVRATLKISTDFPQDELEKRAQNIPEVTKWIGEKEIKRVIIIPNKVINIVI